MYGNQREIKMEKQQVEITCDGGWKQLHDISWNTLFISMAHVVEIIILLQILRKL